MKYAGFDIPSVFVVGYGIDYAEFAGKQVELRIDTTAKCEPCGGSGAKTGTAARTCTMCHGRGQVRAQQGFFVVERTCPTCGGSGRTMRNPCKVCGGAGRVQRERTLSVSVPAGVEDGTRIRLAGEGEAGLRGAPAGDLYVELDGDGLGACRLQFRL